MNKSRILCGMLSLSFFSPVTASEDSWNNLREISHQQQIQVVQTDMKSYEGKFSGLDDESISLLTKDRLIRSSRKNVLRVSLRGPSKRKRNALIGVLVGAGAGLSLGLIASRDDEEGFEFVSDEAVTGGLVVIGAGLGAAVGSIYRAHDYRTLYRAAIPKED